MFGVDVSPVARMSFLVSTFFSPSGVVTVSVHPEFVDSTRLTVKLNCIRS